MPVITASQNGTVSPALVRMRVNHLTAVALLANALVKFANTDVDTAGGWSVLTGLYGVPVSGTYLITAGLKANSSGGSTAFYIQRNGTAVAWSSASQTNAYAGETVTVVMDLQGGDTIGVFAGGSITTNAEAAGYSNYFQVQLLGITAGSLVANLVTPVTDWNTAILPGTYSSAIGATNAPDSTYAYYGTVDSPDSGVTVMQTIKAPSRGMGAATLQRTLAAGTWTAWFIVGGFPTRMTASTPPTVVTATWTEVSLDTLNNNGALLVTPTGSGNKGWVLPFFSYYTFKIDLTWAPNATGRRIVGIGVQGGASAATFLYDSRQSPSAAGYSETVSLGPVLLAAGNYTVWIYQDSGASLATTSVGAYAAPFGRI